MEDVEMSDPKVKLFNILRESMLDLQPQNNSIILTEPNNHGKPGTLEKIRITGIPDGALVIKPEHASIAVVKGENSSYNGHNISKYRRHCDYVIISELAGKGVVFYIEMKSTSRSRDHIQQLWCGRCLMEYINFLIKNLDGIRPAFDLYEHRYVKFCSIPEDKDTTILDISFKQNKRPFPSNILPSQTFVCNVDNDECVELKDLIV